MSVRDAGAAQRWRVPMLCAQVSVDARRPQVLAAVFLVAEPRAAVVDVCAGCGAARNIQRPCEIMDTWQLLALLGICSRAASDSSCCADVGVASGL